MRGIWSERVLPFLLLAAIGAVMVPETAQAQYVGAKRCRPCHLAQFKSWQKTKMANAFELLRPGVRADAKRAHKVDPDKDYTADPKCVQCHVTGYGEPGGFVSLAKTPKLADVQCEVCHGPGKGYMKPNLMSLKNKNYKRSEVIAAGLVIPSAEVCGKCHNEKSPFYKPFDYEERKKQGIHESHPLKYNHD
ncbi:MAG: cytochrome c family protein [Terriglobia bacterium]